MKKPPTGVPPAGSNALTYLVVAFALLLAAAFMYLLFGELFIYAMAVFAVIGAVGCFHYFVWGRALSDEARTAPSEPISETVEPE